MNYYYSIWGSNVAVDKVSYDAEDIETSDSTLVVKTVYTVTVLKQIDGPSFSMAAVIMIDGASPNAVIEAPF